MKKALNNIKNSFITGLLLVLPIGISAWIITKVFNLLDSILGNIIYEKFQLDVPGLGLVVTISLVYIIGFISNRIVGHSITKKFEQMLENIPIIKIVYKPLRTMLRNFSNKDSNNFKQVVFVKFPNKESYSVGFITNDNISIDNMDKIFVFVPTTPNPTNGFLMLYNIEDVIMVDIPVEAALSMVVSLGSSYEGNLTTKKIQNSEES